MDVDAYRKIEEGKLNPSMKILDEISLLFDCSIDYLTGMSEDDTNACILLTSFNAPDGSMISVPNLPPLPGVDTSRFYIAPIVSSIRGGPPFDEEDIKGWMYVDPVISGVNEQDKLFYLRITTDSMTPRYLPGDLVLIRQQSTISDGEVAAVLIKEKEACLRKVYFTNDDIWLHSTNPAYEPVKVKADDVLILGKAIYRLG
jgi:SOS-response transcriptional repressor LexA